MNKEIDGCGGGGGGVGGGGDITNAGGGGDGGGIWPSSSSLRRPSDMFGCRNGVRGSGPPAFLTKTFNIVNDPNTNSIISWSLLGNSFIIWDHLQFSAEILPRYFKHSNFSSFIYQLNNYGFRKIGVDHQWEYENPNFQAGKVYLLTNIKRRRQNPETVTRRGPKRTLNFHSINNNGMEIRPEILRNEINETKLEIEKLKRQQADMELHIMAFEAEVKNLENMSQKLIMYWAKACDEIFAQKMREETGEENSDDEAGKKRKLDAPESPMEHPENTETNPGPDDFNGENNQDQEEMVKEDKLSLSENQLVSSTDDSGSQVQQDQEANANSEAGLEKNSGDYTFWKKILLEDDEACENEAGTEMANKQAKIALDLEGLIAKLADQDSERVTTTL
ncbi:hypothetical protein Pfo_023298 [Paulownia fortunei]|nr:hypothetical protein Pfo_023298 [Paulownia fortunei]